MANEKRLIDANALMEEMEYASQGLDRYYCGYAKEFIDHATTVDAVEVVRCKDCRWRNTKGCPYKNFKAAERDDDDFCSDGERKENG